MSLKFSTIPQKRLLQGITSTSTQFYLNNILSFDGITDVLSTDLGTQHYCAFRNDTGSVLELMEIDPATISAGPITILRRGLSFYGDRTTEDTDLKLDWPANSIVMLGTDVPQIFQWLKEYIDNASIAGAVPASTTAAGIVVEASQAEVDAGTKTKVISAVTYDLIITPDKVRAKKYQDYAADVGSTDAYAITVSPAPAAYVAGQEFTFKANTANTDAATLNVNSLGAKTIKKNYNVDIATGDIVANQIVKVIYDGTNFQIINNISSPLSITQTFTSNGTWTKPTGAKYVQVIVIGPGGNGGSNGNNGSGASGGGGGGGAINAGIVQASVLTTTVSVVVGTGGSGTASSFSTVSAGAGLNGGNASGGAAGSSGAGGTATGGISGGAGATGGAPGSFARGGGGGGAAGSAGVIFAGGAAGTTDSNLGAGGNGGLLGGGGNNPTGLIGNIYGGGGGGAGYGNADGVNSPGGVGYNGLVIVTTYF